MNEGGSQRENLLEGKNSRDLWEVREVDGGELSRLVGELQMMLGQEEQSRRKLGEELEGAGTKLEEERAKGRVLGNRAAELEASNVALVCELERALRGEAEAVERATRAERRISDTSLVFGQGGSERGGDSEALQGLITELRKEVDSLTREKSRLSRELEEEKRRAGEAEAEALKVTEELREGQAKLKVRLEEATERHRNLLEFVETQRRTRLLLEDQRHAEAEELVRAKDTRIAALEKELSKFKSQKIFKADDHLLSPELKKHEAVNEAEKLHGLEGLERLEGLEELEGLEVLEALEGLEGLEGADGAKEAEEAKDRECLKELDGMEGAVGTKGDLIVIVSELNSKTVEIATLRDALARNGDSPDSADQLRAKQLEAELRRCEKALKVERQTWERKVEEFHDELIKVKSKFSEQILEKDEAIVRLRAKLRKAEAALSLYEQQIKEFNSR